MTRNGDLAEIRRLVDVLVLLEDQARGEAMKFQNRKMVIPEFVELKKPEILIKKMSRVVGFINDIDKIQVAVSSALLSVKELATVSEGLDYTTQQMWRKTLQRRVGALKDCQEMLQICRADLENYNRLLQSVQYILTSPKFLGG